MWDLQNQLCLKVWTPVRGDEVGGYSTGEVQVAEQPRALDDAEQLDQQVGSALGQVVLVGQPGEESTGRVHRVGVAAQEVGAEEDQSPHLFLTQGICCRQETLLEVHSPPPQAWRLHSKSPLTVTGT